MKKTILVLFFVIVLLAGCSKKMNMNNVKNEPNFSGIVEEVSEQSILVKVNEAEDEFQSSDLMSVSLDVELKDSITNFNIGDEVKIYYDGNIAESYPAQINKVYAITLINPSHLVGDNKEETDDSIKWDLIPMVMIDGNLYLDTGIETTVDDKAHVIGGEITSEVDGGEKPTINEQSNFGAGYRYQYGEIEGTINIFMNDKWWLFATEKAKEDISKFTKEEIAEAIKAVKDNFNFPASTLTKVWYNREESDKLAKLYLQSGKGSINGVKAENVIVLLSNFDVDDSGDNPVLNSDSTYENFQWILIRDSKESDWIIDDWGY